MASHALLKRWRKSWTYQRKTFMQTNFYFIIMVSRFKIGYTWDILRCQQVFVCKRYMYMIKWDYFVMTLWYTHWTQVCNLVQSTNGILLWHRYPFSACHYCKKVYLSVLSAEIRMNAEINHNMCLPILNCITFNKGKKVF